MIEFEYTFGILLTLNICKEYKILQNFWPPIINDWARDLRHGTFLNKSKYSLNILFTKVLQNFWYTFFSKGCIHRDNPQKNVPRKVGYRVSSCVSTKPLM